MSFLIAVGIGLIATPVARAVGLLSGVVDRPAPGVLKIHRKPVPLTGGLAVVVSTILALWATGHLPSPWVLGAVGLAFAVGMVDDVVPLPPAGRLLLQVGAGLLLVAGGVRLEALGIFGEAAVVLLAVACTNAVNIIDGQDGLAGGLGAIAALGLILVLAGTGEDAGIGLGLAIAGALVGFLVLNRPPARIFLGNGGAYAVGIILATLVAVAGREGWRGLLAAGVCLGVFAFELVFTVARRVLARSPMSEGDRGHSYDIVATRTGDRVATTLVFWGLGALVASLALIVSRIPLPAGAVLAAASAVAGAFWALRLMEMRTRLERPA